LQLEEIYENIINWTNDDAVRRTYEEKLLKRGYLKQGVLPMNQKKETRDKIFEWAKGLVILKHPYELAWMIVIEWADVADLGMWMKLILAIHSNHH